MRWSPQMLRPLPSDPDCVRALAWYDVDDRSPIADLDDPHELLSQKLRPSVVITRDYGRTQAWALTMYDSDAFIGIRWWSYHDSRWATMGLWNLDSIVDSGAELLDIEHPAIREAADVLSIRVARR
jgi:RES domain